MSDTPTDTPAEQCPGSGQPWHLERRPGVNPMCPVCYIQFIGGGVAVVDGFYQPPGVPQHPAGLRRTDGPWPRPNPPASNHVEYGDPAVAKANVILQSLVGSGVHGIAIEGTDDRDEMGVFIEPPEYVVGVLAWSYTHQQAYYDDGHGHPNYTWRTQAEGDRSGPGDLDLVMHSLRKYLRLAAKGNPTALLPLFAPADDLVWCNVFGSELRGMRDLFLSQRAVERFLGYMENQRERMLGGGKQNRVPNRPELVEAYGYDVKYAAHCLRLAYQGREVATTGTLSLPMREEERLRVLEVKAGAVPDLADVDRWVGELETETRWTLQEGRCPLPEQPSWEWINGWCIETHRRHWAQRWPEMYGG